jgi:hypothetical protein
MPSRIAPHPDDSRELDVLDGARSGHADVALLAPRSVSIDRALTLEVLAPLHSVSMQSMEHRAHSLSLLTAVAGWAGLMTRA